MQVTVKYFGLTAEITQCEEESIAFSGKFISDLVRELSDKYPELKEKDFQVAQGQELVPMETEISGKDIALLPPFAGG